MAVITVSRQLGTGADEICRRAAAELGYQVVDRELIRDIAEEAQVTEEEVRNFDDVDERGLRGFMRNLAYYDLQAIATPVAAPPFGGFRGGSVGTDDVARGDELYPAAHFIDRMEYQETMRRLLHRLYERGGLILMGRGANFVLAGQPHLVRVRLVASEERRVALLMDDGVRFEDAREEVRSSDRRRAAFIHNSYDADWDDPLCYDLVMNVGTMERAAAAAQLVAAARAAGG